MKRIFIILAFLWGSIDITMANDSSIISGCWKIVYDSNSKCLDFIYNGQVILKDVYARIKNHCDYLDSYEYPAINLTEDSFNDVTGAGSKFTFLYSGLSGQPDIKQVFYMYPEHSYFLTDVYLVSSEKTSSNYMAPVMTATQSCFLDDDVNNRVLSVPFDNDKWVRYSASQLNKDSVSFEVTAIFSSKNRKGLVLGSVEHDTWKTGIRYSTSENKYINKIECYGGITHIITNDINTPASGLPSKEHGSIYGTVLKSPKVMVGMFDDWREGMDTYGRLNALIAPPRAWTKGNIFGWNSWGGMAKNVNYNGVLDVSDFFAGTLQKNGFSNGGTVYMVLDSYWDNMNEYQLKDFARHCIANGQAPGIYWSPFSDWGENGDRVMEGSNFLYKDAYLYVNGKIRKISSRALDPTHPGTKARMDYFVNKFKTWGFKYIKLDFLNNGILEADSYYDKNVTTGVQAYNEGMKYLSDLCGDDIYLGLSIAPLFPSQYGNSRRISCDAWGSAEDCEYVLNSLSFGWWLANVYCNNDPDHIVLEGYSEGENRMRVTSAATTGIYIMGDNLSLRGTYPGTPEARQKAVNFTSNSEINALAHLGKSFYPVEGNTAAAFDRAENQFMLKTGNDVYLAIYNYNKSSAISGMIDISRLGLKAENVLSVKEIWSGKMVSLSGDNIEYIVPSHDVNVYKFVVDSDKTVINHAVLEHPIININGSILTIMAQVPVRSLKIFNLNGSLEKSFNFKSISPFVQVNVGKVLKGIYLIKVKTSDNKEIACKVGCK